MDNRGWEWLGLHKDVDAVEEEIWDANLQFWDAGQKEIDP